MVRRLTPRNRPYTAESHQQKSDILSVLRVSDLVSIRPTFDLRAERRCASAVTCKTSKVDTLSEQKKYRKIYPKKKIVKEYNFQRSKTFGFFGVILIPYIKLIHGITIGAQRPRVFVCVM